ADTPATIPAHWQIQQALDDQFLQFVQEQVLDLKILDPAMGSGHFLVNATHAVANFIVELLNETPWENPTIDTDVVTWKRRVAERCIFGVDLNELAVELAKLCLWMTTAARGKPLTFLDHHLRWGNSLVGAWLKDVGVYPLTKKKDQPAFTLPLGSFQVTLDQVLAGYRELYAKNSDDVEEVRQKARLFDQEIWPALQRYRELLDLHTGVYFGNGLDEETYIQAGAIVHDAEAWAWLKSQKLGSTLAEQQQRRWFHWELEFPEVFCGREWGFDVFLGNPPYVEIAQDELYHYLQLVLPTRPVAAGLDARVPSNTYACMLESVSGTMKNKGWLGYVVPNSAVCSAAFRRTRQLLRTQFDVLMISNFSIRPQPIFPGVMQRVSILLGRRGRSSHPRVLTTRYIRPTAETRSTLLEHLQYAEISELAWLREEYIPKLGTSIDVQLYEKTLATGNRISDLVRMRGEPRTHVYYHDSGESYWTKALPYVPIAIRGGERVAASEWKSILAPARYSGFVTCLLNSSFFYWYWLTVSDCRHLTQSTVLGCPIPDFEAIDETRVVFDRLCNTLVTCYERNTRLVEKRPGYTSPEIAVRKCKETIGLIDAAIGKVFEFEPEWITYLVNYDAECRAAEWEE
ncbi:MAG: DNA methyltransferase, partial [Candidatus Hadarchaeum sp.]